MPKSQLLTLVVIDHVTYIQPQMGIVIELPSALVIEGRQLKARVIYGSGGLNNWYSGGSNCSVSSAGEHMALMFLFRMSQKQ